MRYHGKHKFWVVLYWEGGRRQYHTIGPASLSKGEAQKEQATFMQEVNARLSSEADPGMTFGPFLEGVALPFYRLRWKTSTAHTTENRMRHHLWEAFKDTQLHRLGLRELQGFLNSKAKSGLSRSIVAHLRWDLSAIFKVALAEGYVQRDVSVALYIPKEAAVAPTRAMTAEEVTQYLNVLDLREKTIASLAIFSGMRPGEILGLQRRHISEDCKEVVIAQRVYRSFIDTPKTMSSRRTVAVPTQTANQLREWMDVVGEGPDAWVFASEKAEKPMWKDNLWHRHMRAKLESIGLKWANFQVLRRTNASLGHAARLDAKTMADQRGHGLGVSMNVYTKAALNKRAEAAEILESAVLNP